MNFGEADVRPDNSLLITTTLIAGGGWTGVTDGYTCFYFP